MRSKGKGREYSLFGSPRSRQSNQKHGHVHQVARLDRAHSLEQVSRTGCFGETWRSHEFSQSGTKPSLSCSSSTSRRDTSRVKAFTQPSSKMTSQAITTSKQHFFPWRVTEELFYSASGSRDTRAVAFPSTATQPCLRLTSKKCLTFTTRTRR